MVSATASLFDTIAQLAGPEIGRDVK